MGLITVVIAICLVVMTVVLIRMRRTTPEPAAENIEMESGVYEDIRAESHGIAIKTECNEAYNYVTKGRLG